MSETNVKMYPRSHTWPNIQGWIAARTCTDTEPVLTVPQWCIDVITETQDQPGFTVMEAWQGHVSEAFPVSSGGFPSLIYNNICPLIAN